MSRYDKYDPVSGGFRAPLAANFAYTSGNPDFAHADLGKMRGVSLDASGNVVIGGAITAQLGVLILTEPKAAGAIVDVMTDGEIVEFLLANGSAAAAGTVYYANGTAGDYSSSAPAAAANGLRIGHTVEAGRLVVRCQQVQSP